MSTSVTFEKATRIYPGSEKPAVDALDLVIEPGEFLVLVGPSGCGKSTSLRMLAGLEDVTSGRILIGDKDVTHLRPKDRDIAMVFQNYALYPHMSVGENMGFALKIAGIAKSDIQTRVREAAKILDLEDYLDRKPKALSGGQRQRVAMGRAIVRQPQVFLMDEPLSNLDAKLRVSTRTQIASLQRRLDTTTVYVTHDQVEAMTMGDRVAVLKDGLLQQVDTPLGLYDSPEERVRRRLHRLTGDEPRHVHRRRRPRAHRRGEGAAPPVDGRRDQGRQGAARLPPRGAGAGLRERPGVVPGRGARHRGARLGRLPLRQPDRRRPAIGDHIVARIAPRSVPAKGAKVWFSIAPGRIHAFDVDSGDALPDGLIRWLSRDERSVALAAQPAAVRQPSACTMSSTRSLASPKSIRELSLKNSGFCTPA